MRWVPHKGYVHPSFTLPREKPRTGSLGSARVARVRWLPLRPGFRLKSESPASEKRPLGSNLPADQARVGAF